MKPLREHVGEGLKHLAWSFVWKFLGAEALISVGATGAAAWAWHLAHAASVALPLSFYVVVALLMFCAMTLFAILVLVLHNSVNRVSPAAVEPQPSPPPSSLVIRGAFYGNSADNEVSVLPRLLSLPRDAFAIYVTNNNVDAEPSPNIGGKKRLRVRYSYLNDAVWETSREEGEWLVLPDPTDRKKQIR